MILGTVQLGLEYGITNNTGKPDRIHAYEILDYAYRNGVLMLDTASAYGDAEEIIGEYIGNSKSQMKICTKLPISIHGSMEGLLEESLRKLRQTELEVLYLHRFEQVKENELLEELQRLRKKGKIKKIGVSIYEPIELECLICDYSQYIDVVQLPYNLIDCERWQKNNLLKRASERFIIYARSIYLQGLLVADSERSSKLGYDRAWIVELAKKKGVSVQELAMGFVKCSDCITDFLVGCENLQQVKDNIKYMHTKCIFTEKDMELIVNKGRRVPEMIIDPRRWNE